jgi:hypothetical protein
MKFLPLGFSSPNTSQKADYKHPQLFSQLAANVPKYFAIDATIAAFESDLALSLI